MLLACLWLAWGSPHPTSGTLLELATRVYHVGHRLAVEQLPCQGPLAAALSVPQLSGLLACLPREGEMGKLQSYTGPREALRLPEQFMMEVRTGVGSAPFTMLSQMLHVPCVRQRIEAGHLYHTADDDLSTLQGSITTLQTALVQLRGSFTLAALQQIVLVMGNWLNQGSKSGDCVGFRVESLLRLRDSKSPSKRGHTLLHAVAQELSDNFPNRRSLLGDVPALAPAAKLAVAPLRKELEVLGTRLAAVQEAADMLATMHDDHAAVAFAQVLLNEYLYSAAVGP